jgi:mRNA-degrading endonuclease RelE of RelBE toxin-antitoxin system
MSNRKRKRTGERRRPPLADEPEVDTEVNPWRIRFAKSVRDTDLHTLSTSAVEAAKKSIEKKLKLDPQQYGEYLHRPLQGLYKLKTSAVRIVYHVDAEAREVWILAMGDRRDIWKDEAALLRHCDAARGEFRPDDVAARPSDKQRNR